VKDGKKSESRSKTKKFRENKSRCNTCHKMHLGECRFAPCKNCKKPGHATKDCTEVRKCFECGDVNHLRPNCPKLKTNKPGETNKAKGRVYVMNAEEARKDPNVVTGTFLVNDIYANVLFDSGANRSFVSTAFRPLLNKETQRLSDVFIVELANGREIEIFEVIKGCKINIDGNELPLELMPMELGGFDIVLGMDWLSSNQAQIICDKKLIRIQTPNGKIITIYGDQERNAINTISVMKANKCLRKGCIAYLAYAIVAEKEKKLENVPVLQSMQKYFQKIYQDFHLFDK
jgi:hypothetical protein